MSTRSMAVLAALQLLLYPVVTSADFAKGQAAYSSGDYETALSEWQPLAEGGNPDAQFGMGLLYANGFGVMLDDAEALKWYTLAAGQDHGEAQANLGVMHANGWGVPQNDAEAFKWYSFAAEHGILTAQTSVAKMYEGGFGTEQDLIQAHRWYSIASDLGDYNAASKRDDLSGRMSAEQVAEANDLAATWLETYRSLQANQ